MSQVCPLSFKMIDGTIARIGALFVSLLFILFLVTGEVLFLYMLAVDFMLRLYGNRAFSPIYQASLAVEHLLGLEAVMVDSGAKRVAAFFGLGFVLLSVLLFHLKLDMALYSVSAIFLTCTSLELLFSYCLGCKIYFLYKKLF